MSFPLHMTPTLSSSYPRPLDARPVDEAGERDLHVDLPQVVLARPADFHRDPRVRLAPDLGQRDLLLAREVLPRDRPLGRDDVLHPALRDDLAAMQAGAGADV